MRRDLAVVGSVLVCAGVLLSLFPWLDPGLAGLLPPRALAALAVLTAAAGAAVVVLSGSTTDGARDHTAPDAGTGPDVPTVGAEFDRALARVETMSATRLRRSDGPAYISGRLRQAAVVTVARERGVDHDRAAAIVDRGEWTDDPVAAAFLSSTISAPLSIRVREVLSTTPRVVARARRTAANLEDRP